MAKNDLPDLMGDRMGELLGGRKDTQKTDRQPTKTPRKVHRRPTKTPQRGALQKYHIRLHEEDWNRLKDHFETKGLSASSGIRMIIKEFMEREGI